MDEPAWIFSPLFYSFGAEADLLPYLRDPFNFVFTQPSVTVKQNKFLNLRVYPTVFCFWNTAKLILLRSLECVFTILLSPACRTIGLYFLNAIF